jgi:hypothetical protein
MRKTKISGGSKFRAILQILRAPVAQRQIVHSMGLPLDHGLTFDMTNVLSEVYRSFTSIIDSHFSDIPPASCADSRLSSVNPLPTL